MSEKSGSSLPEMSMSRRDFLLLAGTGAISLLIQSCQMNRFGRNSMSDQKILLYVGTYQKEDPNAPGTMRKGIYTYQLDRDSGQLSLHSEINDIENPSFLAVDSQQRFLYAVNENYRPEDCSVHAYRIDPQSGMLSYINQQPSLGSSPCYVTVDQTDHLVAVANYSSGSVTVLPIGENGDLLPSSDFHQHSGSGIDPDRQEGPHAHCSVIDPTNRYLFAADLGIDKIMGYRLDLGGNQLIPHVPPYFEMPPGCGPRHIRFHPDGGLAYVINELDSTITALNYDSAGGSFSMIETVSTLPEDYQGESFCAELCIAPKGNFLYGSNRGHDSLAIFAIDETAGRLSLVAHQSTHGKTPRNFAIDPSGTFLLVANQDSDNIVTFHIDPSSGFLEYVEQITDIHKPVCLKMITL
jgi:6-phosphogluconolactonase